MTDQEIKELVSNKVLKNITDYAVQTVLRRVLFYDKNKIDWQDFYENLKQQMPEVTLMGESRYLVTFVNSNDTSSHAKVEANSDKEARKKVKELYGKEVYRVVSVEKIAESAVKLAVNKILEGADVRSIVLEYVPDITQRYPEGMSDLSDSEDSDFEPVLVKDVVKSIEADVADGDFYNHINVWKNNKKIADLYNVSDLEMFKNDFVHNWRWFDDIIDVYLV